MKIRTQFTLTVALFGVLFVIVGSGLFLLNRQMELLRQQEDIAHQLELGARELSYLANDFLLHGEDQQRLRWETKYSWFTEILVNFVPNSPKLAALSEEIEASRTRLGAVFAEVAPTLRTHLSVDSGAAYLARVRISWTRIEVHTQSIAFSASQVARLLEQRIDLLHRRSVTFLFALLGVFGAFFVTNYLTVNRRVLLALSELQERTKRIGAGNLDPVAGESTADEIGDLSRAFDRMTVDLKAVTASKHDLEQEMRERRQVEETLRQSEEKYRNLFENMTEEVHFWQIVRDDRGEIMTWRLVDANPPALVSWCRNIEEIRGKTTDEIFGPGASQHYMYVVRKIMTEGVPYYFEDYFPHLDKYFRFTSVPLRDHFITTGADITEQKRVEAALKKSNQELEQFAYVASHDLQEPLRAIVGFLQLLESNYGERLDEKGRHYIERAVKGGHRMQRLIRDLLILSRVSTKGTTFKRKNLNQTVQQVLGDLELMIGEKNARVICTDLPSLAVDDFQIQRLFQNLIVNGLRYNVDPEPVVEIGCREQESYYEFSVKDNGIGISPKFHERIFIVFQRLHTESEYPGTGLGLALCKKIVERHGGSIWLDSEPGKGATFHFTLSKNRG